MSHDTLEQLKRPLTEPAADADTPAPAEAGAQASAAAEAGAGRSLVSKVKDAEGVDILQLTEEQLQHLSQRPVSFDGFRLERVDVYNWGSFNNNVKSVYFGGQNVLMTGDNGAGKSSIIDAITVLLYDVRKVVFNQAAGAEKGERNLASYVLGLYKNDNTSGIKTELGLRSGQNAVLSVIMATFYHHQLQEHVVLLQCLVMLKNKSAPNRYYFIGDRDFNLQQDVLPVSELKELSAKLRKLGMKRYEQFSEYYAQMQRLFGIGDTKVLDLFYKTISMKSINNISDFVRKQMLEDFNGDELVEQIIDRFNDLDAAYKSVEEARLQVEALEPICRKGEEYQTTCSQIEFLEKCDYGNNSYLYKRKAELIQSHMESNRARLQDLELQISKTKDELSKLGERIQATNNEILQQGGNRHDILKNSIRVEQKERDRLLQEYTYYSNLLRNLQLEAPQCEADFTKLSSKLDELYAQLQSESKGIEEHLTEQNMDLSSEQKVENQLRTEIASLKARKNNIPSEYITLRQRICEYVGCNEKELPFAGELMQIKAEEKSVWEYALEKTLHGFGLTLLVKEEYFPRVVSYVNQNNTGLLLHFDRIKENDFAATSTMGAAFSKAQGASALTRARMSIAALPRKIEIKNEGAFYGYIKNVLEHNFNFVCTEDEVEYRQERFALMPSGLCKRGGRNEKDDRRRRLDYILGWTNEEKIARLQTDLQRSREHIVALKDAVRNLNSMRQLNEGKRRSIDLLKEKKSFAQLDYFSCDLKINALQEELDELMRSSDVLKSLKKLLEEYEQDRKSLQERSDSFVAERARVLERNEHYEREYHVAVSLGEPAQFIQSEVVTALERLIADACERLRYKEISFENIDRVIEEVGTRLNFEIRRLKQTEASLSQELVNLQSNFTQNFVLAGRNLDATRASAWLGFKEFLDKLQQDDLPRFVEAFKDKLNRETIDQFGSLNAVLISHSRKIQERIADINNIMRDVDFNPDHYIQMVATPSKDQEISQFRSDLRTCTSNILDNDNWTFEEADRKFHEVKALIDRFKGEVNGADIDGRWRRKVTDVKQWFDFSASEHARSDDRQVDYYEDSGGKSGGQKEKLAYTVLASSLAYQYQSKAREREEAAAAAAAAKAYGSSMPEADTLVATAIAGDSENERSFRFVIIDEAFGRGSPQSVDYALTLFSKFNLQLLVATPMQKLDIIEKYVNHVAFVYRDEESHESTVINYDLHDYILKRNLKERLQKAPLLRQRTAAAATGAGADADSAARAAALTAKMAEKERAQVEDAMQKLDERIRKEQSKFAGPSQGPVHLGTSTKADTAPAAAASAPVAPAPAPAPAAAAAPASSAATTTASAAATASSTSAAAATAGQDTGVNRLGGLQIKGQDGKYLSVAEYNRQRQEERRAYLQSRTDEALSKLDFLDRMPLFADNSAEDRLHYGQTESVSDKDKATAASASTSGAPASGTGASSTVDFVSLMSDFDAALAVERRNKPYTNNVKPEQKRKGKTTEEEPKYKQSLEDLMLEDEDF